MNILINPPHPPPREGFDSALVRVWTGFFLRVNLLGKVVCRTRECVQNEFRGEMGFFHVIAILEFFVALAFWLARVVRPTPIGFLVGSSLLFLRVKLALP